MNLGMSIDMTKECVFPVETRVINFRGIVVQFLSQPSPPAKLQQWIHGAKGIIREGCSLWPHEKASPIVAVQGSLIVTNKVSQYLSAVVTICK